LIQHGFPERWSGVSGVASIAAVAYGLFAAVLAHGGWTRLILGPIFLWWGGASLCTALSLALCKPGVWPRGRRSRYLAGLNALIVGGWLGLSGAAAPVLLVLPVYSHFERAIWRRLFPPSETAFYLGWPLWIGILGLAETLGYVFGLWTLRVTGWL
jgi:hypothetical protein